MDVPYFQNEDFVHVLHERPLRPYKSRVQEVILAFQGKFRPPARFIDFTYLHLDHVKSTEDLQLK